MSAEWKVAPKDATHYFDGDRLYAAHWLKTGFYCVTGFENDGWREDHQPLPLSRCEERPKQPQSWSGPEDGLPPVNTLCEMHIEVEDIWVLGRVIAHAQLDDGLVAVAHNESEVFHGIAEDFRPIKTAAQIRETAIREIMDAAGIDCLVTATRLVDAGFKREVV